MLMLRVQPFMKLYHRGALSWQCYVMYRHRSCLIHCVLVLQGFICACISQISTRPCHTTGTATGTCNFRLPAEIGCSAGITSAHILSMVLQSRCTCGFFVGFVQCL